MRVEHARGVTVAEALAGLTIVIVVLLLVVPVYFDYRRKAVDTTMRGVLHNAKKAMEAFYAANASYEGVTVDDLRANGLRQPLAIEVEIVRSSNDEYEIRACADGATSSFKYDSEAGSTVRDDAVCRAEKTPSP